MKLLLGTILLCAVIATDAVADGCSGVVFQPPVRYPASADEAVLLRDLDGDGAPEILTSGNHVDQRGAFSLLSNGGDGTFANEVQVPGRFGEKLEDMADFDGDGLADVVASNFWMNGISVYPGTGPQQFGAGMFYETATHGGPTRVVDYDRDGALDLASFSFGSVNPVRVHLFRGRRDGTFDPKRTFEVPLGVAASPSTRIHQGAVEVLVDDFSGHLGIVRLGAGGISVEILDAGPGMDLNSMFADVNGDGLADIVETNDGGSETPPRARELIFVTLANPEGGFHERRQLARPRRLAYPVELDAGDFDGDGRLDLIAGDVRATTLYFYRGGNVPGDFGAGVVFDVGGPLNDIAVGDVNRDGRPDVVAVTDDRTVSVILNGGRCVPARGRTVRH